VLPKLLKKLSTDGIEKRGPITGKAFIDSAAIGKNCPNKLMMPYTCRIIPVIPHRHMTRNIPPKKAAIPRALSFLVKNRTVLETPIVIVNPERKRISPNASKAESKRNITPRARNKQP
jgi:hypothetical protein